jgi:predicted ATP-dependent endonuclease of OLD family
VLRCAGLNPLKEGIAVIPVHGVGNLAKWWRFFTAYGIPTYPIFDNDAKDDPDEKKRSDILSAIGVEAAVQTQVAKLQGLAHRAKRKHSRQEL